MKNIFLFILIQSINSYMYPSKLKTKITNHVLLHKNLQKDIIKIHDFDAQYISKYWYDESKKHNINNNLNELIYFTKILNNDYKNENEYILWTPKIRICLPNDELIENNRKDRLLFPQFRETLCLICFENNKNNINIKSKVNSPFWIQENQYINKKIKCVLIEYFLKYLKHNNIEFKNIDI